MEKKTNYKTLDCLSNQIGNFLLKNNCKPNDRIIIFTEKNYRMYASILGVLKSGACWVPLSSFFPKKRIFGLIKTIKPKLIITDKKIYLQSKVLITEKF